MDSGAFKRNRRNRRETDALVAVLDGPVGADAVLPGGRSTYRVAFAVVGDAA